MVCTHIDIDHIGGLLGLFLELNSIKADSSGEKLKIENLWHNSFQELLGARPKDIAKVNEFLTSVEPLRYSDFEKSNTLSVIKAVGEGIELGDLAGQLSIPFNNQFKNGLAFTDKNTGPIKIGGATLQILGPSLKNVERLRRLWNDWIAKHGKNKVNYSQFADLVAIDSSVSNLSSIMFLMEYDGKRAIFTGDGLSSDLIEMLLLKDMLNND